MQPKFGGDELVDIFLERLRDGAKIEFMYIEKDNDKKRRFFDVCTMTIKYISYKITFTTQTHINFINILLGFEN